MRAGQRPEDQDQHDQNRAGRQRVAQERQRDVTAGKLLRHDAGADHGGEQERRAERFGDSARAAATASAAPRAFAVAPSPRPISRSLLLQRQPIERSQSAAP